MENNVREELEVLKRMLHNWKVGFMDWASPDGDNDHVIMEFTEEIQSNLYPYVRRLFETSHLTEVEAKEFMVYCYGQVEDLRNQLRDVETNQSQQEV
jgi:hypothetical protein